MNVLAQTQRETAGRKIHYVDRVIQKRLLVALVVMEVLLVTAALWILYRQLGAVLEHDLYRIHYSHSQQIFPVLLKNSLYVLGGLIGANVVALLVADRIWAHYVNIILRSFSGLMARTEELDFLGDEHDTAHQHEVIELALAWRETERARCQRIRKEIRGLDSEDPRLREHAKEVLGRLGQLLP